MDFNQVMPVASVLIALATVLFTTVLLSRQVKQMEHERNALAILAAIDRLSDEAVVRVFERLRGVSDRYASERELLERYPGSEDEHALSVVGQYVETVACLARRGAIDPSLIVDAVGLMIRTRWKTIRPFVRRLRHCFGNEYMFENFEWLARYSEWWKETPRPPKDANYDPSRLPDLPQL